MVYIPRFTETYDGDTSITLASGGGDDIDGDGMPDLQVSDWCTQAFNDTPASFSVPANNSGYVVFARITGKPCSYKDEEGNCQTSTTLSNELEFVTDKQGNNLMVLGFVTRSGEWTDMTLYREADGTKTKGPGGKGVQKSAKLSNAFTFSGAVCYIAPGDQSDFCENQNQTSTPVNTDGDTVIDYWLPTGAWFSDDPDDNGDGAATTMWA